MFRILFALALTLPAAAMAQREDRPVLVLRPHPPSAALYLFESSDISAASGGTDSAGRYSLHISLAPKAAGRLAELSRASLDQTVDFILCDRLVMSPVMRSEITGGQLVVNGIETSAEVDEMIGQLYGVLPCPKE